jgi:hypothetical protein
LNLTLTLEDEISVLEKYRLTPTELFLLRVLLIFQDENDTKLFSNYIKTLKQAGVNLRSVLQNLQNKGIILKSYKIPEEGQQFDPFDIEINRNFIKTLYKCSFELGKELFENYPQFTTINNSIASLRGVSKFFNSLEDAYFKYGRYIKWNVETHNHIIELVKWGKEHDVIKQSLGSFIVNNAWLDLEALQNGDTVNYNYDSIREL